MYFCHFCSLVLLPLHSLKALVKEFSLPFWLYFILFYFYFFIFLFIVLNKICHVPRSNNLFRLFLDGFHSTCETNRGRDKTESTHFAPPVSDMWQTINTCPCSSLVYLVAERESRQRNTITHTCDHIDLYLLGT